MVLKAVFLSGESHLMSPRIDKIPHDAIFCIYMLNQIDYMTTFSLAFRRNYRRPMAILLLLFVCLSCSQANADSSAVIVNSSVVQDTLSLKELRSIFTMKQRLWPSGERVSVYVFSNQNAIHKNFCRNKLNVFARQLESVWYRLVYSGTGERPVQVVSEQEMIEKVSQTPGAIGYIQSEIVHENTKIIRLN